MKARQRIEKLLRSTAVDEIRRINAPHKVDPQFLKDVLDSEPGRAFRRTQAQAIVDILLELVDMCPDCEGTGEYEDEPATYCGTCNGRGKVVSE